MKIIMHYPETEQGMNELKNTVATVHAESVKKYIKNLSCPKEQKIELCNAVADNSRYDEKN